MFERDKQVTKLALQGLSNREIAKQVGFSDWTISQDRERLGLPASAVKGGPKAAEPDTKPGKTPAAKMDLDVSTGTGWFDNIISDAPITDWAHVFAQFKLDPTEFVIADDTVRMSVWQQSKALEDGTRDIVNLYSYKARFTRKTADHGVSISEARQSLRNWHPVFMKAATGQPEGFGPALADFQFGKGEGDGTAGTLKRLDTSLDGTLEQIDRLRSRGNNLRTLMLANMGDHTEGTHGSYANQPYTVDMNLRDQLQLALEVNLHWVKTLAPMFEHVQYAATLCNHGTLSRAGGRENITDDADNATGLVTDLLQKICGMDRNLKHVQFIAPRDEFITTTTVEGVNIAMAHGQKITGSEANWLAAQSQNLTQRRKFVPDLWLTAHKHHAQVTDYGPYTRIQATTVEPGSKYFEDMTGQYSRTGVTTFTVGKHLPGMWDNYRIV